MQRLVREGAVANRCAPWRYHANFEHCVVEVVGEDLREYQLHHHRDGRFELRLAAWDDRDTSLVGALREVWDDEAGDAVLGFIRVEAIAIKEPG